MKGKTNASVDFFTGDGQIAFDEFVECFGAKELTSTPDVATLEETFRVFDKVKPNNSGFF